MRRYQELSCSPRQPLSSRVFLGWDFPFEFLWLTLCKMHLLYWHHGKPTALLSFITLQRPRATSLMQRLELSKLLIPTPAHTPLTEGLLRSQYLFIYCAVEYRGSSWSFSLPWPLPETKLFSCFKWLWGHTFWVPQTLWRDLPPPWLWQCASPSLFSCLCKSHWWWSWRPRLAKREQQNN